MRVMIFEITVLVEMIKKQLNVQVFENTLKKLAKVSCKDTLKKLAKVSCKIAVWCWLFYCGSYLA